MELPVLPMKFRSQLIFPICGKCPELYYDKNEGEKSCPHNDAGREFVTTVTSQELLYAMHQGYELKKIYHVLQYKEGSDSIFKDYVEASEPPSSYSSLEGRKKFEDLYQDIYDIKLDECRSNPGRRFIAKLFLNSLWGRFALSVHEEKKIVSKEEYYSYVRDPTIFDLSSYYLSDGTKMIRFKRDQNYCTARNVNIMLSLWTTAAAKLHLYKFMKLIQSFRGCHILYTDTDSIIYFHPWNFNPLEDGELLGEMTNEIGEDKEIISYASGGAKQYHLELIDKEGVKSTSTKIRGIVSNAETERKITRKTFKYNPSKSVILQNTSIGPSHDLTVLTRKSTKIYRTVCKKGIIAGQKVFPYGWKFGKPVYRTNIDATTDSVSVRPFVFNYNFTGSSRNV
uniref:DNA-directed DNA polymerase n=1 Tax=Panagrolaimus superbus TaxID=310955 RepID=A0A914YYQ6_9BILA